MGNLLEKLRSRLRELKPSVKSLRRLAAFGLGFLLLFICVEVALGVASKAFVAKQFAANGEDLVDGQVRILCIGESTTGIAGNPAGTMLSTAYSYPAQLEAMLNRRNDGRSYRVLNLGILGGTTESILDLLPRAIEEGDPHIIIAMMGIKDGDTRGEARGKVFAVPRWLRGLNMFKLSRWLLEDLYFRRNAYHLDVERAADIPESMKGFDYRSRTHLMESDLFALDTPEAVAGRDAAEVALYYWYIGRLGKAEEVLRKSIAENGYGYSVLAQVLANSERINEVVGVMNEAMRVRPEEPLYAVVLAELLDEQGYSEEAVGVAAQWLSRLSASSRELDVYAARRLTVVKAQAEMSLGQTSSANTTLRSLKKLGRADDDRAYGESTRLLESVAMSELFAARKKLDRAEEKLLFAIDRERKSHSSVYALSKMYREQGRHAEEKELRRWLLAQEGRMAEYFELAKLYRLTGDADKVPELLSDAVKQIPSLRDSHEALYETAAGRGIHLIVMQYPSFSLDLLHQYAPPAPNVSFIDNEQVFAVDPDRYWYEPSFPNSFSHYSYEGAIVLAENMLAPVVAAVDQLGI